MDYATATLKEIVTEPGVSDLPMRARNHFALALKKEAQGKQAQAEIQLEKAL